MKLHLGAGAWLGIPKYKLDVAFISLHLTNTLVADQCCCHDRECPQAVVVRDTGPQHDSTLFLLVFLVVQVWARCFQVLNLLFKN